jgi:hypothetical protein
MDAARELYAKDPVPQLTILAGKLAERVKVLEEQTKYLSARIADTIRSGNQSKEDLEFAAKYGDAETIRKLSISGAGPIQSVMPIIRQRKDADVVISKLQQLKGGQHRKLTQRKQTRRQ